MSNLIIIGLKSDNNQVSIYDHSIVSCGKQDYGNSRIYPYGQFFYNEISNMIRFRYIDINNDSTLSINAMTSFIVNSCSSELESVLTYLGYGKNVKIDFKLDIVCKNTIQSCRLDKMDDIAYIFLVVKLSDLLNGKSLIVPIYGAYSKLDDTMVITNATLSNIRPLGNNHKYILVNDKYENLVLYEKETNQITSTLRYEIHDGFTSSIDGDCFYDGDRILFLGDPTSDNAIEYEDPSLVSTRDFIRIGNKVYSACGGDYLQDATLITIDYDTMSHTSIEIPIEYALVRLFKYNGVIYIAAVSHEDIDDTIVLNLDIYDSSMTLITHQTRTDDIASLSPVRALDNVYIRNVSGVPIVYAAIYEDQTTDAINHFAYGISYNIDSDETIYMDAISTPNNIEGIYCETLLGHYNY